MVLSERSAKDFNFYRKDLFTKEKKNQLFSISYLSKACRNELVNLLYQSWENCGPWCFLNSPPKTSIFLKKNQLFSISYLSKACRNELVNLLYQSWENCGPWCFLNSPPKTSIFLKKNQLFSISKTDAYVYGLLKGKWLRYLQCNLEFFKTCLMMSSVLCGLLLKKGYSCLVCLFI